MTTRPVEIDFSDLAPLAPVPEDVHTEQGFIQSWDDSDLFWQCWEAEGAKASIALMHGFGEHSSRYNHFASALVRAGFNVMAIDARGHGRSTGPRGHVYAYDDYVRDFSTLVGEVSKRWSLPIFSFGHSNGGLITLRHALMKDDRVMGYVVTSPFCGFKIEVPMWKAIAGNGLSKIWPTLSMPTDLDAATVSHIPEVVAKYARDPLNVSVASTRWFTETKSAQADLLARSREIDQPFFFLVAGDDLLVDPRSAEEVFHHMGSHDRQFEILPDLYHEVLNEEPWDDLTVQIVEWLERHLPEA